MSDNQNNYNQQMEMADAEVKNSSNIKCQNCGANTAYDPDSGCLKCEHCGNEVTFQSSITNENALEHLFQSRHAQWDETTKVVHCQNCGAKEVVQKNEISLTCPFCGTQNVLEQNEISGMKPTGVVPFKLSKDSAIEYILKWRMSKLFAPNEFRKKDTIENVKGVYNPSFTFDAITYTTYNGILERQETYTVNVGDRVETRTKYVRFPISGTYSDSFDDILVQASSNISQNVIDKIQPFYTNDAKNYDDSFLQGFSANQYCKDGKQCWSEAKIAIDDSIRSGILSQYVYTSIISFNAQTNYTNLTYKYLLIPIYVGFNRWKEKLYNVFVNGENGKVTGKIPYSFIKISLAVLLGLGVLAAIIVPIVLFI